ncbi:hypothetical protein [Roseovarius salinarum]|uniref:hypothetical protein n=1 Tax=Roseovarius salinarum TaxID=1981892 RepID=UPI001E4864A8|nr:hypothetical protein [Roseovarius salinarum]
MRNPIILCTVTLLAGCGGAPPPERPELAAPVARIASGPISRACMESDRPGRSRELCGCIQAVADRTLTGAEQSRAVTFYRDPHAAQEVRQSDRHSDERFWDRYKAYGTEAERICS